MNTLQLSKTSCDPCRVDKVYCDKVIPSCSRCNHIETKCSYLYVPKIRVRKPKKLTTATNLGAIALTDSKCKLIRDENGERGAVTINDFYRNINDKKYMKLYVSSGGYMLATNFFKNSMINKDHKVFSSSNGKLDYFGVSPLALLLTMYVVHNTNPEKLNNYVRTLNTNTKPTNAINKLPITSKLKLNQLNQLPIVNEIKEFATDAFFSYFHPHLPVLNKNKFRLHFDNQPKLLQYIVVGIGIGYLPYIEPDVKRHYCALAQLELKKEYCNMNINTLSGILIMCMFQHNQEDLKSGFQNLGIAITISRCLGLHLNPPKHISRDEKELRIRLYWVVHFVDKLYGFSMTLPFSHDYRLFQVPKPKLAKFDYFEDDSEEYKFGTLCSIHYLNLVSELCQMLYLIKLKFNFVYIISSNQLQELIYLVKVIDNHLKFWETKVTLTYNDLHKNVPWKVKVGNRFELYLKLVYNSALTQLYQTFNKVQLDSNTSQHLKLKAESHSKNAITNALFISTDFLTYGLTYRFYALSTAVFYWVKVTTDAEGNERLKKLNLLKQALQLLENCTPYYLLAQESLKMSKLLAKSESITLD